MLPVLQLGFFWNNIGFAFETTDKRERGWSVSKNSKGEGL
jgi:hypothetical protein